jgi:hypothetical protein
VSATAPGRRRVEPADLLSGARLPGFLRRPIGVDDARRALARRLETREGTFLEPVRRTVDARTATPYARLLRHAGCAYADPERLLPGRHRPGVARVRLLEVERRVPETTPAGKVLHVHRVTGGLNGAS